MTAERDGVLTLVRVIDQIMLTAVGDAPPELPEGKLAVTYVVMLKSGDARGGHELNISVEPPHGISPAPQVVEFTSAGETRAST